MRVDFSRFPSAAGFRENPKNQRAATKFVKRPLALPLTKRKRQRSIERAGGQHENAVPVIFCFSDILEADSQDNALGLRQEEYVHEIFY